MITPSTLYKLSLNWWQSLSCGGSWDLWSGIPSSLMESKDDVLELELVVTRTWVQLTVWVSWSWAAAECFSAVSMSSDDCWSSQCMPGKSWMGIVNSGVKWRWEIWKISSSSNCALDGVCGRSWDGIRCFILDSRYMYHSKVVPSLRLQSWGLLIWSKDLSPKSSTRVCDLQHEVIASQMPCWKNQPQLEPHLW